ncbi:hypothetical protein GUITHDRAFT_151691 [Guillardia theta CCMP2712]|uniref:O-GlcNAc transferase C-terminal domain-containing protein n=1 Tax=Guillardia theta (strain CCMP2712) TaxID=905079 RepID=L1JK04_GUITC|nr:hypothetical protein GUITHDRAFT_151691 [Guillardia theta CCMP2712]EKX48801.1 hypothetical protein GUITHDRAFT_151691 [Guillardia theta CCMP2712]|eukprot:XP_005835781.1 hypothetical protein GUITHDRAFT_151691 [Guillardia theta CCMP2712]
MSILKKTPNSVIALLNITGSPLGPCCPLHPLPSCPPLLLLLLFLFSLLIVVFVVFFSSGADLFLDNTFYNAGTTGSDVLYAGVPVISLSGRRTLSRMGASLAAAMNFFDLLVRDLDEYVDLAVRLGQNPRRLAETKMKLHRHTRLGLLFDADRWVVAYEAMLAAMWDAAIADGIRTGGREEEEGRKRKSIVISSHVLDPG